MDITNNFVKNKLTCPISVTGIYTVHYFKYGKNFRVREESHDFWEFIYVDKGDVEITAGEERVHLHTNEIFFHEPNEFHTVHIGEKTAPNAVIVSFACHDEIMQLFRQITAKGCAIIMSTHNTALIEQYPARTVMFSKGRVEEIDIESSFTE